MGVEEVAVASCSVDTGEVGDEGTGGVPSIEEGDKETY